MHVVVRQTLLQAGVRHVLIGHKNRLDLNHLGCIQGKECMHSQHPKIHISISLLFFISSIAQWEIVSYSVESMHMGWILIGLGIMHAFTHAKQHVRTTASCLCAVVAFYIMFFNWRANLDLNSPIMAGIEKRNNS